MREEFVRSVLERHLKIYEDASKYNNEYWKRVIEAIEEIAFDLDIELKKGE